MRQGEAWNGLMHDLMQQPADRVSLGWAAVPFFVSYVLVSTFIVLKMMIAIMCAQMHVHVMHI